MQGRITVKFCPTRAQADALEKQYPDFKIYYLEAMQAFFKLSTDLEKSLEHFCLRRGVSRARYLVMAILMQEEGERMTPNQIAARLNVTRGNMTSVIDGLVKEGFVKKYEDEVDRRQVWIQLLPEGQQFMRKILPEYFKALAKFMSAISKSDIDALTRISRKLHTSLDAFNDE